MLTMEGIQEDASFHLGEKFDSYEELEQKLEKFSKQSLVHYWRRDSRTVSGAHMKTSRPINECLKYYSVKYACIYGGQKFLPRGAGRRQSQSIRTNCPAHIMLRASKDGTKLEVTSVNNDHNHEISEELFKSLPQERKLSGEIRQEVQDLMQLHIDRKRLKEYVRLHTNKILRSKDLFNIAAANKSKHEITPERAYYLYKKIHDIEIMKGNNNRSFGSESEDEVVQSAKRIKIENTPWTQDSSLSGDIEGNEGQDDDESYNAHLQQEDVVDDTDTTEGDLLATSNDGDVIIATSEIVEEQVMENNDPPVIVQSLVNVEFVDDKYKNYCGDPLGHSIEDSNSPTNMRVLNIRSISASSKMDSVSKDKRIFHLDEPKLMRHECHSMLTDQDFQEPSNGGIMLDKEDDGTSGDHESEGPDVNSTRENKDEMESPEVILSEEASHRLLQEQLAVLQAEKEKLCQETEMLKLKKDKLKIQMSCYKNEISKQEMEKEKLRLEIKLLQSKVVEDSNDETHYIFVP